MSKNHGGESEGFTSDSNKLNLSNLPVKQKEDQMINSDTMIGFVN